MQSRPRTQTLALFSRTRVSRSLPYLSALPAGSVPVSPSLSRSLPSPFRVFLRAPWFFSHSAPCRISSIRLIVRRDDKKRREEREIRRLYEEQGSGETEEEGVKGDAGVGGGRLREETDERTDGRTDEPRRLPRRNIKLNKRSIFCSLFLTRVELRHFATLFPPRSPRRPAVSLPPLYYPLPLPLPRALPPCFFPSPVPSFSFPP